MTDPEQDPQKRYIDPSTGFNEADRMNSNPDNITNQPNDMGTPMHPTEMTGHEMEQRINTVQGDNQLNNSTMRQPDISSDETMRIPESWFSKEQVDDLRTRWKDIQFQFVESPCSAVEQGDTLVAEVIEQLAQALSSTQNSLNQRWLSHDDVTTEELRQTLQSYREVLDRLLAL